MLDAKKDATTDSPSTGGLKGFNQTGREDTASVILRPQVDPAVQRRNVVLIAVVVVLLVIVGALAFSRSHLSLIPSPDENDKSNKNSQPFGPPSGGSQSESSE